MKSKKPARTPFWFAHVLLAAATSLSAATASAHEGHGLPGVSHWHGTDVWGFLAIGGIAAFVIWMKGRK